MVTVGILPLGMWLKMPSPCREVARIAAEPSAHFMCRWFGDEGFPSARGRSMKWELGFGSSKKLKFHKKTEREGREAFLFYS